MKNDIGKLLKENIGPFIAAFGIGYLENSDFMMGLYTKNEFVRENDIKASDFIALALIAYYAVSDSRTQKKLAPYVASIGSIALYEKSESLLSDSKGLEPRQVKALQDDFLKDLPQSWGDFDKEDE